MMVSPTSTPPDVAGTCERLPHGGPRTFRQKSTHLHAILMWCEFGHVTLQNWGMTLMMVSPTSTPPDVTADPPAISFVTRNCPAHTHLVGANRPFQLP